MSPRPLATSLLQRAPGIFPTQERQVADYAGLMSHAPCGALGEPLVGHYFEVVSKSERSEECNEQAI